ncbi:cytochrome P450 [Streptomyces sp. CBMA370]|uniref:cytochrome P450 n=1 Tax=Streptomyces sp. CBMA370 TaxID=1930278 RepID=UPI002948B930|nr:cytochrome P450 [Streptomyces sp. CBMA370]
MPESESGPVPDAGGGHASRESAPEREPAPGAGGGRGCPVGASGAEPPPPLATPTPLAPLTTPAPVTTPLTAPGSWPLLGHLPYLFTRPLEFLDSLPAYGGVVRVRMGPQVLHVVSDPALVRRVLTDRRSFDRDGVLYDKVRAVLGNGLATCPHAEHLGQRRTLQPAFRPGLMDRYAAVMTAENRALTERWRPGEVVDVTEEAFRLTTAVTLRTLFSAGLDPVAGEELRAALDVLLRGVYTRVVVPGVDRVPSPARRRYRRALAAWRTGVGALVAAHRASGADHGDALSLLLAARDDRGRPLPDGELGDQAATLVLAGAETTSSVVAWALRLLADHPGALARLHAEVDTVLGGRPPTGADLPRLPYTGDVVREVLRLYPPAWAVTRTATRRAELAPGLAVPEGAMVVCCLYLVHRRPDLHRDPARFDPDRWGAGEVPREAFLPFGLGATKCLGDVFGTMEATLALAAVAARWRLTPLSARPPRPVPRIVLSPGPQRMLLAARQGPGGARKT